MTAKRRSYLLSGCRPQIMTNIVYFFKYDTINSQCKITYNLAYVTLKQCGRGSVVRPMYEGEGPMLCLRNGRAFKLCPGPEKPTIMQSLRVTKGRFLLDC